MTTLKYGLSQEQLALLPSNEDVAFYEEHGWFITPKKVIPDEVIDEAILGAEKFYDGERDAILPQSSGYIDWKVGDGNAIRNKEFACFQKKELRQLGLQPIIGAIAARLARTKEIRLFDDSLVYKGPVTSDCEGVVGWHTDNCYSSNCTSDKMLTAWMPLHDSEENRSPLVVIDGSHKWPDTENLRFFNNPNLKEVEKQFTQEGRKIVEVPMIMKKGHISFHHCKVIHGSYPNYSNSARLALSVYLQDSDNHYQDFWNNGKEIHHFVDYMCQKLPNGNPDYNDPLVCPVLWSGKNL